MKRMIEIFPEIEITGKLFPPLVLLMKCRHIAKWESEERVYLELIDTHMNAAIAQYSGNNSKLELCIANPNRFGRINIAGIITTTVLACRATLKVEDLLGLGVGDIIEVTLR